MNAFFSLHSYIACQATVIRIHYILSSLFKDLTDFRQIIFISFDI